MGIIVCYYTVGPYEAEAARLCRSLVAAGLHQYFVSEVPQQKDWFAGVHLRAEFLQSCRKAFPDQVLLSLDADAVVHKDPWPFLPKGAWDLACHTFVRKGRPNELLPGTLALQPTPKTDRLLSVWKEQNKRNPQWPDRKTFAAALGVVGCCPAHLPAELCWIFDLSREAYGARVPVIEHLQASRSFRRSGAAGTLAERRLKRINELDKETRQ